MGELPGMAVSQSGKNEYLCAIIFSCKMAGAEKIKSIIAQGEGLNIEFKKSRDSLSRSAFETVCAFLNRKGGHILLGVKDDGTIEGVSGESLPAQLKTLANDMNNSQIITPATHIETEVVEIDGKKIICIYVPESSQVHSCKGIYYDRQGEVDIKLTTYMQKTNLYIRKQDGQTENRVYPQLKLSDFVNEDFDYVRARVGIFDAKHPWTKMSNEEILRSAKMYRRDEQSGKEGYTLAAALVFGTTGILREICPYYKTEALCRKEDLLRYDDRDTVDCNLLQAYERLMAFVRKHTPDRFYLEGGTRISLREVIFREAVTNLLIHREFSNDYRAMLTIYKDTVVTENWTIPHQMGRITPFNLKPHSKNPVIAAFFKQIHWVEDLGSGVRNMYRYLPVYVKDKNVQPIMEENDVFKLTVKYGRENSVSVPDNFGMLVSSEDKILALIQENPNITAKEMGEILSMTIRNIRRLIAALVNENKIERIGSDKSGKWMLK
jgi:ATP-dependent DNA helicase RecG